MCREFHQYGGQEGGDVVGKSLDKGTETQNTRVERNQLSPLTLLLLHIPPVLATFPGHLDPDLVPELVQELGQGLLAHEAAVEEAPQHLGRLLPHRDVLILQQRGRNS